MSDDHQQPYDGLTRWLGEGDDEPSAPGPPDEHRSRSPRVVVRLVALALPWLVTLASLYIVVSAVNPIGEPWVYYSPRSEFPRTLLDVAYELGQAPMNWAP
ncbi:MAG TPA: hypothetical protein VK891_06400, partial [Euzebyales bacterium]|nr:hypothetical protein [Euzebyales bacterium]